ncbi:unnamed protein product [Mortierella alpina]
MDDNPNQSPRNEYVPISEERRKFLEEKYKRRNLAPESLIIRPGLRKLHIATIVAAIGTTITMRHTLVMSHTRNKRIG